MVSPLCVIEGWAPSTSIPTIADISAVSRIDLPKYAIHHPPMASGSRVANKRSLIASATSGTTPIDGNGITIMNLPGYIQQTSVAGGGITIGVISDDVTSLSVIQARAELPTVNVVEPSANPTPHTNLTDEGTMMLEEVYAAAPAANLAFCGPETAVEYLGCLSNLITAGSIVVSDDLSVNGFDIMSAPAENIEGQALESILSANPNVMLFHSVGNDAQDYWQGAFNPLQLGGTCYPSGGQSPQNDSYFQQFGASDGLTWQTIGGHSLGLASVVPAGQTTPNNLDLYVYNPANSQWICSTAQSGWTDGATSYTFLDGSAIPSGTYTILVGAPDSSLSGTLLKLIGTGDGADTFTPVTNGAPSSPQDFSSGVITVGAVYGNDGMGNTIEPFSDTGPIQLESPTLSTLQAPLLVAPDAVYVDNSGTDFSASGGIFYGTSAASPNAAAVAALLRSAFPTLTPIQVTGYLEAGAVQLSTSPWNGTFGYGRVDALGALAMIPAPSITGPQGPPTIVGGTSSPALPFTIGGTGILKVSATPSTALIPASGAGVRILPSNCGSPTASCTLTLTPAIGLVGSTTVQLNVTDGANRTQSVQVPVTVTAPAPPTLVVTSGAAQSVRVNAAIAPITFTVAGTGPLSVSATYSGGSSVTVTPGCGSTVRTCTATLGAASTTVGPTTLLLNVRDPYNQTASRTATLTITPPAKPTITITAGASQSVAVNSAIAPVSFKLTGTAPLTVVPNTSDISSVSISAGCGTTTMSCVANLGTAEGSAGTATLTLTVQDHYAQSATASATITETAATAGSSGGGGALDRWALFALVSLVLVRAVVLISRPRTAAEKNT
jgi:hypothetical protein